MAVAMRAASKLAIVLGLAAGAGGAGAQERHRGRAEPGLERHFEAVRRAFAEHGTIVDTAPDINGERTTRRFSLLRGSDACRWIVVADAAVTVRRASPPRYRYTTEIDLRALDPGRIAAHPLRAWDWCCRRSAEVSFADAEGRQSILTRHGESWSIAERGWLHFSGEAAAARAAAAMAEAVRACRRPGV